MNLALELIKVWVSCPVLQSLVRWEVTLNEPEFTWGLVEVF